MLHFNIVTIFPEFFASPLAASLLGKACDKGLITFSFINPRDFSTSAHKHVDDCPYGGGPGMVMQVEPLATAIKSIRHPGRILAMSPSGLPFNQQIAKDLSLEKSITVICGRYEGIDARLNEIFPIEELSLCDAVLNGGETAALAVIEAVSRYVSGFMGKNESAEEETFSHGLLEYPHYTRPENFDGHRVPPPLLSGNHGLIANWRRNRTLEKTLALRPDLLNSAPLSARDAETLKQAPRSCPGRNLAFCLVHYPICLDNHRTGVSSLTNLDIHDIARISRSYGMRDFYILTPLPDQLELAKSIVNHWISGRAKDSDRRRALALVRPVSSLHEASEMVIAKYGVPPVYIGSSAQWPHAKNAPAPLVPADVLNLCAAGPVVILLGTAKGLGSEILAKCQGQLRPLRFLNDNHLSVRAAAAILADRILGDYH